MTGACCFRRFKSDENALISGNQMKQSKCQVGSPSLWLTLHGNIDMRIGIFLGFKKLVF